MNIEPAGSIEAFDAVGISRRISSIQRWTAGIQYVLDYPEADWRHYLPGIPPTVESKKEAIVWIMDRLEMHTTVLNGMIRDTMPDERRDNE